MQDTTNERGCLVVAQKLVTWPRSVRTPALLVWDGSRRHKAKRFQACLDQPEVRRWLKVFRLSTHSPDLNDIERLWRHVKRTAFADLLFKTFEGFKGHLLRALERVNGDSDRITGIVFKPGWTDERAAEAAVPGGRPFTSGGKDDPVISRVDPVAACRERLLSSGLQARTDESPIRGAGLARRAPTGKPRRFSRPVRG